MGGKGSGGYRKNALPRDKNPAIQYSDPTNVNPDTNSKVLAFGKEIMRFEPPDFGDVASVEQRFFDYLDLCERCKMRPMVTSLANAFGMSRFELYDLVMGRVNWANWKGGVLTPESFRAIQKAYNFLATAWESYLVEETGNPVKWLFLGKNYFGMKDQTERVEIRADLTPRLPSAEEVAAKYAKQLGKAPDALPQSAEVIEIKDVSE